MLTEPLFRSRIPMHTKSIQVELSAISKHQYSECTPQCILHRRKALYDRPLAATYIRSFLGSHKAEYPEIKQN